MALTLWLVPICLFALFVYVCYKCHYPPNYKFMNEMVRKHGPPFWPIIGSCGPVGSEAITRFLTSLTSTYPSPMYAKFGWQYSVMVYKAEHVEAVLTDNKNLRKPFTYNFLRPWFGNGLLTSAGSEWHRQRKLLTPSFHFRILSDFVPIMNEAAQTLVSRWRQQQCLMQRKPFDIYHSVTLMALDIIMETSMGHKIDAQSSPETPYARAISTFTDSLTQRIAHPWLWPDWLFAISGPVFCRGFSYHSDSDLGRRSRKALKVLHAWTQKVMLDREYELKKLNAITTSEPNLPKRPLAFLDLLLELKHKGQLTQMEVQQQVDTFMFEGHDTTTHGIIWALYCLAANPEAQERAREEILEVTGENRADPITTEHLPHLKYLDCCIRETLRLYPSVPVVARQNDHALVLDADHILPAGIMLSIEFYRLHRDPAHFPDPLKFDPDRFLPENTANRHPFAYCPFAGGPRNCIGQRFALMELKIALSIFLKNFRFETTTTPEDCGIVYQIILRPAVNMLLTLTPL